MSKKGKTQHVFIVGSKGIPANYGGFETFVDKLTFYNKNSQIKYHVSCAVYNKKDFKNLDREFEYNNAHCFRVNVPNIGAGRAIVYDLKSIDYCIKYIEKNNIKNPIIYVLACRIGPFISRYKRKLKKLNGKLYVNPDGHEWLRAKWSAPVKEYWKLSERLMVKHSDLLICDNTYIEKFIHENYSKYNPKTTFIAYGAELESSKLTSNDKKVKDWYEKHNVRPNNYYVSVGRLVPENNFEIMVREFMKTNIDKDFVLINKIDDKFLNELKQKLHFENDKRIKFVGGIYDQELLKYIRENAFGYIHGHEVGGTNPALLESLGITNLNLLFDVCFNKEVGSDAAIYWNKEVDNLKTVLESADNLSEKEIKDIGKKAKERIIKNYSWEHIVNEYEKVLLKK